LSDSNSLTVMVGMERGVGAGGSSKSSRLIRLLGLPGVATLWRDLCGERWLLMYCNRFGSVADLLGVWDA
jgi:hypothetical protein